MQYDYKKEIVITYSEMDSSGVLSLQNALLISQDVASEYLESMGSGNGTLRQKNLAAWVITKLAMKINKMPTFQEKVFVHAFVSKLSRIYLECESTFYNAQGEVLFVTKTQACPIDIENRKIRPIDSISFPSDFECTLSQFTDPFERMTDNVNEFDLALEQKIYSCDIDYCEHVNNVIYIKQVLNTFSTAELRKRKIKGLHINYLKETYEGDLLTVYKKDNGDKSEFIIQKKDDSVFRAVLFWE
ncbi:MAG: hypothetical protein IJX06_01145 [Clostridia bacterium]|nr:hypothetical protein [Clostridia bacterium]